MVIGDVVNLASRIESLNKKYGSQLLVSAAVANMLTELPPATTDLGVVPVRGHEHGIQLFNMA